VFVEAQFMTRMRTLGKALLGAVAGAVVCLTLIAFVMAALSYIPPDDRTGTLLFLLGVGIGSPAGATLAVVAGKREIRGRAKDVLCGTLTGCILALLAAQLVAALATGSDVFTMGKRGADTRWIGLCVALPTGSLLGGLYGFAKGARQRRRGGATAPPADAPTA
jgi:hypothetical protein